MADVRPLPMRSRHLAAGAALGVFVCITTARADAKTNAPVSVVFDYAAPEGCPSPAAFRERIEARGERRAVVVGAEQRAALRVRVLVTGASDGSARSRVVIVSSGGESSERSFVAATCDEVVDASALLVAIAVEAEPPPAAPESAALSRRAPRAPSVLAVVGYVNAGVGAGLGPSPGPVLEAGAGIRSNAGWGPEARIEGRRAWLGTAEAAGGAARFDLTAVAVEGCPLSLRGYGLRAAPCLAISVGSLAATASGYPAARDSASFHAGAELGARLTMDVGSLFFVGTEAWAALPLTPQTFVFGTSATAHRVASLGFSGSASLGVHFE